ncbi:hypothetical protein ACFWPK_33425 [Nocardia sp. NPDC058519]|uniref:hypothetical protein n=1 Tax=Nocardia sp. NPDC058519 TaxID=3346535 RepID=UPI00364F3087
MDPVTLIVAAVAAGAAAGVTKVATQVVTDAYESFKGLLTRKYEVIEAEVVGVERDPVEPLRRELLAKELARTTVGEDLEIRSAAEELLRVIADQAPAAAEAVGVRLTRVEAGQEIEISDISGYAARAVEATDVKAGGSIRISGIRAGSPDEDPSTAPR